MKELSLNSARQREDKEKFQHLIHALVRIKEKTGKPSSEIVSKTLRRGKEVVALSCYY